MEIAIISLLILISAGLITSLVLIWQLKPGLTNQQSKELGELREMIQKTLGDQKADFRDFNAENAERLRKNVQDSLTNQALTLEKRFESLQAQTDKRLQEIRGNVEKKLKENLEQNFGAFKEMSKSLTQLKSSADQMLKVSQQVGELNHILASPKLQGNFGETALHDLLQDILPTGAYEWQPRLAEGCQPDATIRIKDLRLCVDSKFPKDRIANLLQEAKEEKDKLQAQKELASVIKHMAADISKKYIRPEIGTADQAFMFVPSESLYYEILKQPDLVEYCRSKKVSLTSPNTLAATLYAVALAFRGYEMQENARQLMYSIQDLNKHFQNFRQDFTKVGQRLRQAQDDYTKADRDLERFDKTINKLRDGEAQFQLESQPSNDNDES